MDSITIHYYKGHEDDNPERLCVPIDDVACITITSTLKPGAVCEMTPRVLVDALLLGSTEHVLGDYTPVAMDQTFVRTCADCQHRRGSKCKAYPDPVTGRSEKCVVLREIGVSCPGFIEKTKRVVPDEDGGL